MARILRLQKLSISLEHSLGFLHSGISDHCSGMHPSDVSNHCCIEGEG